MKRAYSLVELLVVISLIASLTAMIFPVFAQVREKGRSTTCVSNLRQLGSAMAMYAQDFDELYPRATDVLTRHVYSISANPDNDPIYKELPLLTEILKPYVKNTDTFFQNYLMGDGHAKRLSFDECIEASLIALDKEK